ncbi:hypothetical protein Ddye_023886 [Dipteronia dyeriana]|uniref:DUF659 domain-containing protein n=1 Tax=Dipteronia dyeriana TaxID=168575 RepID=A0AAD9WTN5_9ROSI|nr:hypothetical protein Ddye_023886 [Dipteronia dyeriana]
MSKWVYQAGIPFNAIDNDCFLQMVEAIGRFGPSFKPPSQWQLREPLLKEKFETTKEALKKQEQSWKVDGCSIMTDAWTDRKMRSIMNLCVNSKEGTTFLSSKDSSVEAHTGENIFKYVLSAIEEVGPENVVQVVTDNASNNMAVAKMLKAKMPSIFWSLCATHTINLMLEGIGKLPKFRNTLEEAKSFTIFIYAHHTTFALMRTFTRKRDIMRPGVTRNKDKLRATFTSTDWEKCKWSKSVKGKAAYNTILSTSFWNGVKYCLRVFSPLVWVLRLVDGDQKPSMGFVYGELKKAEEEIQTRLKNAESRLDSPLHLTAYVLNPYYFFNGPTSKIYNNEVSYGFCTFAEILYPDDLEKQNFFVNIEFGKYLGKKGHFGRPLVMKGCEKNDEFYNPVTWWTNYGSETPNLQTIAKMILSLTTSSSGCKRNWSTFEGIHTKKRNRLDMNRLNNLVYVQFNSRLMDKRKIMTDNKVDILLANDASNAQGWIVDDGDDEIEPSSGLDDGDMRDLENDFQSDNEAVEENVEFESDDDIVFQLDEYVVEDEALEAQS